MRSPSSPRAEPIQQDRRPRRRLGRCQALAGWLDVTVFSPLYRSAVAALAREGLHDRGADRAAAVDRRRATIRCAFASPCATAAAWRSSCTTASTIGRRSMSAPTAATIPTTWRASRSSAAPRSNTGQRAAARRPTSSTATTGRPALLPGLPARPATAPRARAARSVFTIHNLAYQGRYPAADVLHRRASTGACSIPARWSSTAGSTC